jgi:3,4-dihydroxy 2-butanone 4-phosphate synthase / GTP cyclohydrolase II
MREGEMALNTTAELIEDIRQGKMIILMDDEDRENEGDLVMAASLVQAEHVNFMAKNARGLICLTLMRERCEQLNLSLMVNKNTSGMSTNFTVSIEAAKGVTTGISAADRAHTIRTAVQPLAKPEDIVQPGHVFPLMARAGGVLNRAGHTEAGCDLARLSGLDPSAVIVEIMNEDGTMARRPDLELFAQKHQLKLGTIADLIHYRTLHEKTIHRVIENTLTTEYGVFRVIGFKDMVDSQIHLALIRGDLSGAEDIPYVRVHIVDPLRDWLGAQVEGKKSWSLSRALQRVASEKAGLVLLIGQPMDAELYLERVQLFLKDRNDTLLSQSSDSKIYRTIGTGSQILRDLGVTQMRLLSSKQKFNALSGFGLEIVEYIEP